jgi:hypothetical protein
MGCAGSCMGMGTQVMYGGLSSSKENDALGKGMPIPRCIASRVLHKYKYFTSTVFFYKIKYCP